MHRPDCCNPNLSHGFMLNSWCCNYVITDFVNNYVFINFYYLGIIMHAIVIIMFCFACITRFVTESIALILKNFAQKNFTINLRLRMGECNERIICGCKF